MSHAGAQDSDDPWLSLLQYTYAPLQHVDEIRLLRIAPGTWNDPIHCDIFHCRLSQNVSYEALSYTWGSEEKPFTINRGENRWLAVTSNCFDAMRRLRKPDRPRTLWIDAVCINQANDLERGHQVKNMPQIYREADQVIVYLGEADDEQSREAWEYIRHYKWLYIEPSRSVALMDLLRRPWFSRIWVLQEVYMARSLTVVYGSMSLPWDPYFRWLKRSPPDMFLDGELPHVLNLHERDRSAGLRGWDLFDLLLDTGKCACTDPRDRIFALLSMCSKESRQRIVPDYESSTRNVYTRVAAHFLESRSLDDVFAAVDRGPGTEELGLLSWVPDWRVQRLCTPISKLVKPTSYGIPRALHTLEDNTLGAQGCCVTVIGDLGDVFEPNETGLDEACITNWCQLFARTYPEANNKDMGEILHMSRQKSRIFNFSTEVKENIKSLLRSSSSELFQNSTTISAERQTWLGEEPRADPYEQIVLDIMQVLQHEMRRWRLCATYHDSIRRYGLFETPLEDIWNQVQTPYRILINSTAFQEYFLHPYDRHNTIVRSTLAEFDELMALMKRRWMVERCAEQYDGGNQSEWLDEDIRQNFRREYANADPRHEDGLEHSFTRDIQRTVRCCRGRRLFVTPSLVGLVPANARQGDMCRLKWAHLTTKTIEYLLKNLVSYRVTLEPEHR
ncbi:hypothetical protein SLS58_002964 [Diplodia intermedia]|uniref:Heterokaryon incompatibility domain-containing protein n=1 Tax=Diplodia intermedia TaxID=856260 RepID=A0ABR3TXC2_9PEZI